ncbi:MAG TPA: LPS export ABC transporter ATP-binding protein [Nitrospirae bacterium]|nr:lipopolysaccharide export system ATP-binding protein LptB [bacterium BMS3Abin06]HDH12193.1 LPS export ABC transporter ATP-binding protein [Nitrospirota bacterium]HDZ03133.1 LPS export ABC transporter ATP-binding protein [Nitrospirota bacterium]
MHSLEVSELKKSYSGKPVVSDITLNINSGEVVGLLGPNGAGKTTTFYMILGLITPDSGDISLDGENLNSSPMYMRARKGIGYLPQEASIFRKLKVEDNIEAVLEITGIDKKAKQEKLESILKEFNLVPIAKRYGYHLSGGERRKVEIARAIAVDPVFILLDEPFAGIDPIAVNELKKTLRQLTDKGIGLIITDHNVRETLSITDRAYIISDGQILAHGAPTDLISNELVKRSYLGEEFRL